MSFLKSNILNIAALLVMILTSVLLYGNLPDQLPSHFNFQGEVDRTSSKQLMAVLLPTVFVAVLIVANILIRISPEKFSMPNSKGALTTIVFGIGVMFIFLHYAMLTNAGDFDFFVQQFSYGMAFFLIITGNVFGKTERNFFVGVRLPWTINSVSNWKATHRFAGWMMVSSGVLLLLINLVYSNLYLMLAFAITPVLLPVIYSIVYYFRYERQSSSQD